MNLTSFSHFSLKVRSHYLSGWFFPDLLSSVPIEVINLILKARASNFLRASKLLKLLRLSRLTKVFRLLKVTKLGKILTELKEFIEDTLKLQIPEAFLILSRLLISLMVLAHWVGCINFMVRESYFYWLYIYLSIIILNNYLFTLSPLFSLSFEICLHICTCIIIYVKNK